MLVPVDGVASLKKIKTLNPPFLKKLHPNKIKQNLNYTILKKFLIASNQLIQINNLAIGGIKCRRV